MSNENCGKKCVAWLVRKNRKGQDLRIQIHVQRINKHLDVDDGKWESSKIENNVLIREPHEETLIEIPDEILKQYPSLQTKMKSSCVSCNGYMLGDNMYVTRISFENDIKRKTWCIKYLTNNFSGNIVDMKKQYLDSVEFL